METHEDEQRKKLNAVNEVVFYDGDYAIIKCYRIFGNGFNCYKADKGNKETVIFTKINERLSWFRTYEAAIKWLEKYKKENAK